MKRVTNRTKKREMFVWRTLTSKGLEDILKANEGETVPGPMMMEPILGNPA